MHKYKIDFLNKSHVKMAIINISGQTIYLSKFDTHQVQDDINQKLKHNITILQYTTGSTIVTNIIKQE